MCPEGKKKKERSKKTDKQRIKKKIHPQPPRALVSVLSNNKRLYHGAQSAADRTAATADMAETSVKQRAAGMEGGSDGDGDGDGGDDRLRIFWCVPCPISHPSPMSHVHVRVGGTLKPYLYQLGQLSYHQHGSRERFF